MEAHSYRYEAGGLSVLGSIHPQAVANRADGTLDLNEVESLIKPDDPHFPRTRLFALENTITGRVLPRKYLEDSVALARKKNISIHLDGARVFNAASQLEMKVKDLCAGFDSVSSCLSKGLGAPAGTVLLGNKSFIGKARRARKILGGGMRQAGVIAAAGLYALENNVQRLRIDHENAGRLARGLRELGLEVQHHTNMVMVKIPADKAQALEAHMKKSGVLVLPRAPMRLVTHLDVDAAGIDRALAAFRSFFS
jgi:threonine aldolase